MIQIVEAYYLEKYTTLNLVTNLKHNGVPVVLSTHQFGTASAAMDFIKQHNPDLKLVITDN